MSFGDYPYSRIDVMNKRDAYFYSEYGGAEFIAAWKMARDEALSALPEPAPAPAPDASIDWPASETVSTARLMEPLLAEISNGPDCSMAAKYWLEALAKKLQVTHRIHRAYGPGFRAVDPDDHLDMGLYVRAAEIFERAYDLHRDTRALNALLKAVDILTACHRHLDFDLGARLASLIEKERAHVIALALQLRAPA